MEESTCYKTVIGLLKRFSLFFDLFISFKHDFNVDAESMIVRTREMPIISANIFYFTVRKFFRSEDLSTFYRSHDKLLREHTTIVLRSEKRVATRHIRTNILW